MSLGKLSYQARRAARLLDRFTDSLTSYRLVYYVLLAFLGWAALAALLGIGQISAKWYQIASSAAWLVLVCWLVNESLAKLLNIAKNKESYLITALILSLIFQPAANLRDYAVLAGAGAVAIASKYLLTFRRAHVFNPAAFGAYIMGLTFHKYAAWWIGTAVLTPVVFVGGWLVLRKMKRYILVTVFLSAVFILIIIHTWNGSLSHSWHNLWRTIVETQLLFFAYIMLTEPMTSPTFMSRYLPYGVVVALFYSSAYWHVGSWQPIFSPEEALLIGNTFAFIFAFSPLYSLKLTNKVEAAEGIKSFYFTKPEGFKFRAGQYMLWTLPFSKSDSRGNRRYITIASSPTEDKLMITLRLPEKMSSFKNHLQESEPGSKLLASRLAGSFKLPENKDQKLAFLAGGVGITPFRSIAKYMIDSGEQRDAALLYSVNNPAEIAFRDVFKDAEKAGLRTFYSDKRLDQALIKKALPDYRERKFYISGPLPFVSAMEEILTTMGVSNRNIKTDYFPGYK